MVTDFAQLLDMGFDKDRAELAVKQTGGRRCSLTLNGSSLQVYSSWCVKLAGE